MVPALILLIIFFSFILIKSSDLVIVALRRLSKQMHTGVFALSAIILALGTSFPELFVGITSAIEKSPNLTLGVVLGSNIANIALVAGIASFVTGKVHIRGDYLKRDVGIAFLAGLLPIGLVADGTLGRVDGLILLAVYGAYASSFFRERYEEIAKEHQKESFFYRFIRQFNHINGVRKKELGRLFLGVALLLFSADMIVRISGNLALSLGLPIFVIGLVILAIGTSLPELAFSFKSLGDREPSMFFGNLLGSTIANSTLVVGITSTIHPIRIQAANEYLAAAVFFVLIYLAFWVFTKSKQRLDRWEALMLILLYTIFVVVGLV